MKKIDLGVIVTTLIIVTISCSLAFFAARVVGEPKDINLKAKNVAITFNDTSIIANGVVSPGWNSTKTFTITNNSKEEYKYNISIKDLINTFVTEGYLQYKITSTNGGYNMTEFKDIPKSSAPKDTILAYSVSIPVGETQSYTIEFKYTNDESVDQSDDMGKKLSGTLFITEGTEDIYAGYEEGTLGYQIMGDNPTISERTDFSTAFTTNTANTLYKAKENNTDVYYFAGIDGILTELGSCKIVYNDYDITFSTESNSEYKVFYAETIEEANSILELGTTSYLTEDKCKSEKLCIVSGEYWSAMLGIDEQDCNEIGLEYNPETNRIWEYKSWGLDKGTNSIINNWVKFGKNESNQDLYWRIIRTNSDGSVRLLYHGTSTTAENAYIGESEFNSSYDDIAYVSYMFGSTGSISNARENTTNSTIKTTIDNWYTSNLEAKGYTKYLSKTAVYCNDRSTSDNTYFGAETRLNTNKTPSYDCTTTEDKFTVDTSTGNGKLKYPIALMTADEISYAGGVYFSGAPTWYYTNSSLKSSTGTQGWWLLSPEIWNDSHAWVFFVRGSSNPGFLNFGYVLNTYGVRPAVSLKSCVKTSGGDGSATNPYTILETTSGC